jgi:hypothetical protein
MYGDQAETIHQTGTEVVYNCFDEVGVDIASHVDARAR